MIFGDEKLFDGAHECATHATKGGGFYFIDTGVVKFISNIGFGAMDVCELTGYLVAERRVIKEPKLWTWEDKKAGRLPEVGCVVMAIGVNEVARIAAINNDSVCSVCVVFEDGGFITLHFSGIAPIETPEEKAQREEDEFVESTCRQNEPHSTLYSDGVRAAYRKLKGGE